MNKKEKKPCKQRSNCFPASGLNMLISLFRTAIVYVFVIFIFRIMGKRQVGEMQPSELVVAIIISELVSLPIEDTSRPLTITFVEVGALLVGEILVSYICMKSMWWRKILTGQPSVLVEKGKINQKEMKKQRVNSNDLLEELRNKGVAGLSEVDYVVLETNGRMSVIQNADNRPLTPKDMNLTPDSVELSYLLVENGKINQHNLKLLGVDGNWIQKQMKQHKIKSVKDIFYMSANLNKEVFLLKKDKKDKAK